MKWTDVKFTDELFVKTDISTKQESDTLKENLYYCKEPIQQLVHLAKYAHTHDNLLPEYKLLMNLYAKQIEMVMGWKL